MVDESKSSVTRLLKAAQDGDQQATAQLMPLVYDELRRLAQHMLREERPDHTLQATALVHEAYLRMVDQTQGPRGRAHFFALAATIIRRLLVDHARARQAAKRGGNATQLILHESQVLAERSSSPIDLVDLHDVLEQLASGHARQAQVVELRFFAGLTTEEIARALNVSTRTVREDWRFARAWLKSRLGRSSGE